MQEKPEQEEEKEMIGADDSSDDSQKSSDESSEENTPEDADLHKENLQSAHPDEREQIRKKSHKIYPGLKEDDVIWTDRDNKSQLYFNVLVGLGLIFVVSISVILNIPALEYYVKILLVFITFGYIIFTEYIYIIIHLNPIKVCQNGIIIPKELLSPKATRFIRWEDMTGFRFSFTLEPNLNIIKIYMKKGRKIRRRVMDARGIRESFQVVGKVEEKAGEKKKKNYEIKG
jgi:hypothetical protein